MIKRKRGRPRREDAAGGGPAENADFDLKLIEEFKKRPAFYDRNHTQYRNRDLLEPHWSSLAQSMGVSGKWLHIFVLYI